MRSIALLLVLVIAGQVFASAEGPRVPEVLKIEGMEPITAADLTQFTGLAVRLAASSKSDPRVEPMLMETLAQGDRGIVKRAVAYMALCAMKQEVLARRLTGSTWRDRNVMKLVRACLADQQVLTDLPR